jgi:hypothetical protein
MQDQISFRVTSLAAVAADGVPVSWQGREFASGPLLIDLDPEAEPSCGLLDYPSRRARAEFHVQMRFPELAQTLEELGAAPEFTKPLRAVIRSEGPIREDHSFVLSGAASVADHTLVDDRVRAGVLPGT